MVTDDQARQFTRGMTTERDVITKLGQPTSHVVKDDGSVQDVYIYTHASPNAVDFVPIVGTLAGGAHGKELTVTFSFDSKGVYQSYSSSNTNVDVHTGLMNQ